MSHRSIALIAWRSSGLDVLKFPYRLSSSRLTWFADVPFAARSRAFIDSEW